MNENIFRDYLKELKIDISDQQLIQLNQYYQLLLEWNQKINLTAIIEKDQVFLKHFYDSLTLSMVYDFNQSITLCDIGTGAGFPGVVLKIIFPKIEVVLVDSLNKRVTFLNEVINKLQLNNIKAIHARAEDFVKLNREQFDVVTSRAVAKLNVINELCIPLVKVNGYFIPMKADAELEIKDAQKSLEILHSNIEEIRKFNLPIEQSLRTLIKIKKEEKTDIKYPRNFEQIKKKPL